MNIQNAHNKRMQSDYRTRYASYLGADAKRYMANRENEKRALAP